MIGKEWLLHLVNCMPRPVEYMWCFTVSLMLYIGYDEGSYCKMAYTWRGKRVRCLN